ncbi:hypothetical protein B0H19DRAFT_1366613 [Mycena capillaripes]|nr:hypothetical protein B0H19DRAFT_1366613 [Mycena capillaripes]
MSSTDSLSFPTLTPRDTVVITSYNAVQGTGVDLAFLQHPVNGSMGVLVNDDGIIAEVREDKWSEFLRYVVDAKETAKKFGGGSWSRPQEDFCPTDIFYDLGPAERKEDFVKFQLTGHQVSGDEPDEILRWLNGKTDIVSEIPPALVKLESAIDALRQELLPNARRQASISGYTKKFWEVVDGMATMNSAAFWS